MVRSWVALIVAGGLLTGVAGCGGGDNDGGDASATIPPEAGLIVEAVPTIRWDKAEYTARAGDVVVAVKQSDPSSKHTLAFVDSDGTQLPQVLEITDVGDAATDVVTLEPGTYTLICTVPGHSQMRAALTVS